MTDIKTPAIRVNQTSDGKIDVSGSNSVDFTDIIINQAANSLWIAYADEDYKNKKVEAVVASLRGIKPQDEIEGMLAAQMIGLHNAAMECMRRAMIQEQTHEGRDCSLSQANKLTRSYALLMEALNRHRGKGQQRMIVEHVNVYEGGQAIVGNVSHPKRGGKTKN